MGIDMGVIYDLYYVLGVICMLAYIKDKCKQNKK